jgi:hypothetical protein
LRLGLGLRRLERAAAASKLAADQGFADRRDDPGIAVDGQVIARPVLVENEHQLLAADLAQQDGSILGRHVRAQERCGRLHLATGDPFRAVHED